MKVFLLNRTQFQRDPHGVPLLLGLLQSKRKLYGGIRFLASAG